jgi:DNA-binding response OmpR family regulator
MNDSKLNSDKQNFDNKIFILEDESDIAELIALNLEKAGFSTRIFSHAEPFLNYLKNDIPNLLILDLMLPDIDGIEVCKSMRKDNIYSRIPIIILTAKTDELDKVLGLELGADDYVTKPFSPRELVARVKAVLRRDNKIITSNQLRIGNILEIDFQKYEVFVNGNKVELTSTEFKILKLLLNKRGWVFTRNQIIEFIDSNDRGIHDRTIDVHIKNLRVKLGEAGAFIINVRGIGYKFSE